MSTGALSSCNAARIRAKFLDFGYGSELANDPHDDEKPTYQHVTSS